jgi:hypothetical protein
MYQQHCDTKWKLDPNDDYSGRQVEQHFLRIRGFSTIEMITTDPQHQMFKEDTNLAARAKHIKSLVSKRVAEVITIVLPEIKQYPVMQKANIFSSWIREKNMFIARNQAPLDQQLKTWQKWIKSPGA